MRSDSLALGNDPFKPDRKVIPCVVDKVPMRLVVVVDLGLLSHESLLSGWEVCRVEKEDGGLRWRGSGCGAYLQALRLKTQFLPTLWAVSSMPLNDLARRFKFEAGVEKLAALGAEDFLGHST